MERRQEAGEGGPSKSRRWFRKGGKGSGGRRGRVYGHRNWSVSRHRAQCAVVQSDCPEKTSSGYFIQQLRNF